MEIIKPEDLINDKIIDYCKPLQLIFVLGFSKSGKIKIAKKLAEQTYKPLFIADEYIESYGYDEALNYMERDLYGCYYSGQSAIFEGILCFRLLRKILEKSNIIPDLVIKTECNNETIKYFYNLEEPNKNINKVIGFNQGTEKIFNECLELLNNQNKKIKLLKLNTSIF